MYRAVAEPEAVNLGLVVGTEAALLVDTGSTPVQGRPSGSPCDGHRPSVAGGGGHPLALDHAFGLAAFGDLETIAHESVPAGSLRGRGAEAARWAWRRRSGLPTRELVVMAAFDLGGRRVEVAHLGAGTPTATWSWWCPTPTCSSPATCWSPPAASFGPTGPRRVGRPWTA